MLSVLAVTAAVWTAVLVLPPPAPTWLLCVLVVVLALGGPTSMIGFDYARTFNPHHRQGTAVGIINMAGFSATLAVSLAVGVVLEIAPGVEARFVKQAVMNVVSDDAADGDADDEADETGEDAGSGVELSKDGDKKPGGTD